MIIIIYSKQFYENKNIELVATQQRRKTRYIIAKSLIVESNIIPTTTNQTHHNFFQIFLNYNNCCKYNKPISDIAEMFLGFIFFYLKQS